MLRNWGCRWYVPYTSPRGEELAGADSYALGPGVGVDVKAAEAP